MKALAVLNSGALAVENFRGYTLGGLRDAGAPEDDILIGAKTALKRSIDEIAETERLRIITPGAGQAAEYQQAQAEAASALTKPSAATPDKFPMLAASIGIDIDPDTGKPAADVLGVARSVQAAAEAWKAVGALIRRTRLSTKLAVDAATSLAEACAAFDAATWEPPRTA